MYGLFINVLLSYEQVYMLWFKFYFPLFLGMVMYDNEFKTKESKLNKNIGMLAMFFIVYVSHLLKAMPTCKNNDSVTLGCFCATCLAKTIPSVTPWVN